MERSAFRLVAYCVACGAVEERRSESDANVEAFTQFDVIMVNAHGRSVVCVASCRRCNLSAQVKEYPANEDARR
ncbi:MAG: hypothetical protein ACO1OB_11870 [Archangium sp.]